MRHLFASIHSGLDPCSGGALAAREMLERLAGRGALPGALGRRDRPRRQRRPDGVHANGVKPRRALTGPERATEFRALEGAREMCMASPELLGVPGTPPRNSHDRVRTSATVAGQGPRRAGTGYGLDATRCRRLGPSAGYDSSRGRVRRPRRGPGRGRTGRRPVHLDLEPGREGLDAPRGDGPPARCDRPVLRFTSWPRSGWCTEWRMGGSALRP